MKILYLLFSLLFLALQVSPGHGIYKNFMDYPFKSDENSF